MYTDIDLKKFIAELKTPWKTMAPDMATAKAIINKYAKTETGLDTVELLAISDSEQEIKISFPNWQAEAEKEFIQQYGLNSGKQIFKKVIMRLYLLSKGTAQQLQ